MRCKECDGKIPPEYDSDWYCSDACFERALNQAWNGRHTCGSCADWNSQGLSSTCPTHDAIQIELHELNEAKKKV